MDEPRFFLAADNRNFDAARFLHGLQHKIPVGGFAQCTGLHRFDVRHRVIVQFLPKVRKRLQHAINAVGGANSFRKDVLSQTYRSTLAMNRVIFAVAVDVSDRQTYGVASDVNGRGGRHGAEKVYRSKKALSLRELLKNCYRCMNESRMQGPSFGSQVQSRNDSPGWDKDFQRKLP